MPSARTGAAIASREGGVAEPGSGDPARDLRGLRAEARPNPAHEARSGAIGAGDGVGRVARVRGESAVLSCASRAPLRLLAPRPRGRACWLVAASYGGGLVDGDAIAIDLEVGEGASLCLATQAETKVYRAAAAGASQTLSARVAPGAALFLLPDPVSAFAGARYRQAQHVRLAEDASLVLLDAVVAGRAARGERWAFSSFASRNTVEVAGRLVLADALRLEADERPSPAARMRGMDLLATVVLLGPALRGDAERLLAETAAAPAVRVADVLVAASPLAGGALLRLAARDVEAGLAALRARLAFLDAQLDDNPLLRRP